MISYFIYGNAKQIANIEKNFLLLYGDILHVSKQLSTQCVNWWYIFLKHLMRFHSIGNPLTKNWKHTDKNWEGRLPSSSLTTRHILLHSSLSLFPFALPISLGFNQFLCELIFCFSISPICSVNHYGILWQIPNWDHYRIVPTLLSVLDRTQDAVNFWPNTWWTGWTAILFKVIQTDTIRAIYYAISEYCGVWILNRKQIYWRSTSYVGVSVFL